MLHQTNPSPKTQLATASNSVNTISCIAVCNGAGPLYQVNCSSLQTIGGEKKFGKVKRSEHLHRSQSFLEYSKKNGMHRGIF